MIRGLFLLILFQLLGELVKIATGVLLPGAVISMLLLFVMFLIRGAIPEDIGHAGGQLIGQLPLLLTPPSVGLFFLGEQMRGQWPAILGAVVFGTAITLLLSAALMAWLTRWAEKDKSA